MEKFRLIQPSLALAPTIRNERPADYRFTYHYHPYGFVGTKKWGIAMPDGKFYTGIMALPLYDGALDGVRGTLKLSGALYPPENGLEAFDATFPPMEKSTLPHQKEFEHAATQLDE